MHYVGKRIAPNGSRVRRHVRTSKVRWDVVAKFMLQRILLITAVMLSLYLLICGFINTVMQDDEPEEIDISEPVMHMTAESVQYSNLSTVIEDMDFDAVIASMDYTTPEEIIPIDTLVDDSPIVSSRSNVTINGYDNSVDYSARIREFYDMIDDIDDPDAILEICEITELQRNLKIQDQDLPHEETSVFHVSNDLETIDEIMNPHVSWTEYTEADLIDVARIVDAEAGADWCTDRHQQAVATVIVNRWKDPKWNDPTIRDVINHEGQYPTKNHWHYSERALRNAKYILENGPLYEAQWQANFIQGDYVVEVFDYRDQGHSITYICN